MVLLVWDFNLYMQLFNGIFGILAVIASFYMYRYHISPFDSWPKNQRIFILYFCFSTATLLSVNCIIVSTIALLTNNSKPFIYHVFRLMLIFVCQQLRFSYFIIIMERMVATIYLEEYSKFSTTFKFYGIFIFLSILGHIICSLSSLLTYLEILPVNFLGGGYENIVWISFITHAITLISCKFLYDKNQQMYKKLAYQCTLQQRHQIVENIKILKTLWPGVLVFSIVAPIGPAATLAFSLITKLQGPIGLFHLTYNCCPIIMAFYCKILSNRKNEIGPSESTVKQNHLVVSPLGAALPTHVSQEAYFNELKNQWN